MATTERSAQREHGPDSYGAGGDHDRTPAPAEPALPVADPAPLGLAAFAATTMVLSVFNAGLMSEDLEHVVLPLALFYGGLSQLLAGMWEFKNRNVFGATAFTSYGAFWLAFAGYVQFVEPTLPEADTHKATALFLLAFAIFTSYMFVASLRVNAATALVFALLAATFIVLTIGDALDTEGIVHVGGFLGLATAAAAWYASFAGVANSTFGKTLLPVVPLKR